MREQRADPARLTDHAELRSAAEHVAVEGQMAGETEASLAVAAVARVLHRHVSEGELTDVLAILPAKLRPLFQAES
jgi:uncharacterized protein (DUF2267 family)